MSERIPVGKCPEHGYVTGDSVVYNFPSAAECECGEELTLCTVAKPERVDKLKNG